jgi:lysozyme family protein
VRADELPGPLALAVFDGAVNHGVTASVKTLQRALANLGLTDVRADGLVGPATLHAAKLCWEEDWEATLGELLALRCIYYADIVRTTPSQGKFHRGWLKRVQAVGIKCTRLTLNGGKA